MTDSQAQNQNYAQPQLKFCKHCGNKIEAAAVICTHCGRQVEELSHSQPSIVINNANSSVNSNVNANVNAPVAGGRLRNKWTVLLLCTFLGFYGGHKFYEGKAGAGVLYLFTGGLFIIGMTIDFITLLFKPNPYYVF